MQKLSILMPVYNEAQTISKVLAKLKSIELIGSIQKEIIIVNDGSSDNSKEIIEEFINQNSDLEINFINKVKNEGKGAAIHTAISKISGDFAIIQDADLEYNPEEFNLLLKPILDGFADVVYGSRLIGGRPHRVLFFWHSIGNMLLSFISNVFTNTNMTDIETCYKMFKSDILKNIELKEKKFGFEPEVTTKVSRIPGVRIYEVGISYYGRTYEEGKKIRWWDGVRAIYCILKYNLWG